MMRRWRWCGGHHKGFLPSLFSWEGRRRGGVGDMLGGCRVVGVLQIKKRRRGKLHVGKGRAQGDAP
jgi:hypothetical protein